MNDVQSAALRLYESATFDWQDWPEDQPLDDAALALLIERGEIEARFEAVFSAENAPGTLTVKGVYSGTIRGSDAVEAKREMMRRILDGSIPEAWCDKPNIPRGVLLCNNTFVATRRRAIADPSPRVMPQSRDWDPGLPRAEQALQVDKQKRRRRKRPAQPKPMTALQLEAYETVSNCKGNFSQAADKLGKNRKTVEQHYNAALAKLATLKSETQANIVPKHRARKLSADQRGQEMVEWNDQKPEWATDE